MKKHKKGSSEKTKHADVYQMVTDRIVAALEQGTAPWRRPWQSAGQV
ncbi:ArdC-like ssDNA-binding domain-containing protein, partial [Salmonella enterica]